MTHPLSPEVEKAIEAAVGDTAQIIKDSITPWGGTGLHEVAMPEIRQALSMLARAIDSSARRDERRKALLKACAIANAEMQSEAVGRDRAAKAGREVVSLCRQAGSEVAERIESRVRALLVVEGEPEPKKEGA